MEPETSRKESPRARYCEVALALPLPQTFSYGVPAELLESLAPGCVVRVPFGRRERVGVVTSLSAKRPQVAVLKEVKGELGEAYRLDSVAMSLGSWIASYYACSLGEALALFYPPRPGTSARKSPLMADDSISQTPHRLSEAQEEALGHVLQALKRQEYESFLLHGVTGSGKTEVYLQAIQRTLGMGKSALVLLPEIALTPQTLRRLRARFPGRVAPYHSRLSHGERCAVWEAAATGQISIVVGARSSAFVPLKNLGLIVVDEEHDSSYKADDRPRYHARDLVLMRARLASIPIVLGSATPSLESYYNARSGKHRRLVLPSRMGMVDLPRVEIVDLRLREEGGDAPLGTRLAEALQEVLDDKEQAILLHNRRGFARFLQCHACGHVETCPSCDISLTWHLKSDLLRCHYCGHRRRRPESCPECGERVLRPHGTGTQRVELALQSRFPEARILRLDQDTSSTKWGHQEILEQFGRGDADILLGTQMVAKGLHFPRVRVVGVISADSGLHFPDLRAHERAFQLLTQVAGRSGRTSPGRVILQTYDPDHRVLRRVLGHDVEGFLAEELEQRKLLGYPPVKRLSAILVSAASEEGLDACLAKLARRLARLLRSSKVEILGPARAALPRINRRFRGQILLKGNLSAEGKRVLGELLAELSSAEKGRSKVDLALDVDPQHLL
jgi:primosomal protein N' (replication factor Y)